jgi:hypothetical protein
MHCKVPSIHKIHTKGGGVEVDSGGALRGRGRQWHTPREAELRSTMVAHGRLEEENGGGALRGQGQGGGVLRGQYRGWQVAAAARQFLG